MPCYSPLKGWKSEETGGIVFKAPAKAVTEKMEVACGQCLGCRLDRSRMWAIRMCHEASLHSDGAGSVFITLTYRDRIACDQKQADRELHIPEDWNLRKDHFQKFMKRLRKRRPGARLKYYHCGEYGRICRHGLDLELVSCPLCKFGRPHYHAVIFNCEFPDKFVSSCQNGVIRYASQELEEIWGYGIVDVGEVTPQSAAYVARYCMKKINGVNAEEHYQQITDDGEIIVVEPEYATMSNGVGKGWYEKFHSDVFPSDEVPVYGAATPISKKAPRYYEELLKQVDETLLQEVKQKRQEFRKENASEYTPERLMSKYNVKKAQTGQLVRTI